MSSDLERAFETNWRQLGGPELVPEYKFHPGRRYKLDFAIPGIRVGIEVEGGIWLDGGGRHNRAEGFIKDCRKYNFLASMGWTVFRLPEPLINDPDHLEMIIKFIERK